MNKELNLRILDAIKTIVENSDGEVAYHVSHRDEKPFMSKGNATRIVSVDIQINREL